MKELQEYDANEIVRVTREVLAADIKPADQVGHKYAIGFRRDGDKILVELGLEAERQ